MVTTWPATAPWSLPLPAPALALDLALDLLCALPDDLVCARSASLVFKSCKHAACVRMGVLRPNRAGRHPPFSRHSVLHWWHSSGHSQLQLVLSKFVA